MYVVTLYKEQFLILPFCTFETTHIVGGLLVVGYTGWINGLSKKVVMA